MTAPRHTTALSAAKVIRGHESRERRKIRLLREAAGRAEQKAKQIMQQKAERWRSFECMTAEWRARCKYLREAGGMYPERTFENYKYDSQHEYTRPYRGD